MATHTSVLAWKSPWTEEPGRLESGGGGGHKDSVMTECCTALRFQSELSDGLAVSG